MYIFESEDVMDHTHVKPLSRIFTFDDIQKKTKEAIAHQIETKHSQLILSPIVEDYVYGTTRTLDVGDYYKTAGKGLWEHAVNQNADYFDITEIEDIAPDVNLPRYLTYRTGHVYVNHKSNSLEDAIGLVFDAVFVKDKYDDMHVTTLFGIDKKKSPSIARTLELYHTRVPVSMGCKISYSICTVCGHECINSFCDCLKHKRGGRINGVKVAELLRGVWFYDLSIVTKPACTTAYAIDVLSEVLPGRILKIAAQTEEGSSLISVINTVYMQIRQAKTKQEKIDLNYKFDMLISKLATIIEEGV